VKQEDAKELFDLIRDKLSGETVFILVILDQENGGIVSNMASAGDVSIALRAIADEHDSERFQVRRETDGPGHERGHETGGSGGH